MITDAALAKVREIIPTTVDYLYSDRENACFGIREPRQVFVTVAVGDWRRLGRPMTLHLTISGA